MSPQSAPFDNPATAPDRSALVKASPHAPDFWVITDYRFYQHGTLESAMTEKARLGTAYPQKGFYVLHCKRRLSQGNSREVIGELRATLQKAKVFVQLVGSLSLDGEKREHAGLPPYEQQAEDAIETLQNLIRAAREIVAEIWQVSP